MIYGDAVRMDGGEISLDNSIDGDLGLSNGIDGAEIGVFYNRGGAVGDYPALSNKPSINGVELVGDKSIEELGVDTLTNLQIQQIFNRVFGG